MTIDERIEKYKTIIPQWTIGDKIGSGSNGKTSVYRMTKSSMGFTETAVLKVVNIIEENMGFARMSKEYEEEFRTKREQLKTKASNEVMLMYNMDNCNNIVSYQWSDYGEVEEDNFLATDLLIRMKEYKDLRYLLKTRKISQREILSIGIDICSALEACQKKNIIHRDIKPENIFYDEEKYLLGDFGISKIIEDGMLAQTNQGTREFAAPEQFKVEGYDFRIDIYSLGLTLYYLANGNKLPFSDVFAVTEHALFKRVSGADIPRIEGVDDSLMDILLKACAFKAEDRYQTPTVMKEALCSLMHKNRLSENGVVLPAAGNVDLFETANSLRKDADFSTESALKVENVYATEPALTNPAASLTRDENVYATEPALTNPAVNLISNENLYATEQALTIPVAEMKSDKEKSLTTMTNEEYWQKTEVASISAAKVQNEPYDKERDNAGQSKQELISIASNAMVAGEREKAMKAFATLAEKEDWNVMYYEVTKYFSDELSIMTHVEDAIYWFEKCIEKCRDSWTISLAEFQLGEIYSKGLGIKKNHKLAEKYYASSAAKGNLYAKKKFVAKKYVK